MRSTARRPRRLVAVFAAAAMFAAACGDGGTDDAPEQTGTGDAADGEQDTELSIAFASFDVAVGEDQRVLAGLLTSERQLLAFGEVDVEFGFLGDAPSGEVELEQATEARFLPIPGMEPEGSSDQPSLLPDASSSGVYEARVDFDQAGYWGMRVRAELEDGRQFEGQTTFAVLAAPLVPAVGDEAPRSQNLTVEDVEEGVAQPVSLDSRAQDEDAEVPDHHLHDTTVADAIDEGRPVVVMISTPVYCVSRFCGPLTEVVSDVALRYEDTAEFVHIEVWEDFDGQVLNPAAAEWIQTEQGGNEPWVFLVDADGQVAARWDNVLDVEELEQELEALQTTAR